MSCAAGGAMAIEPTQAHERRGTYVGAAAWGWPETRGTPSLPVGMYTTLLFLPDLAMSLRAAG